MTITRTVNRWNEIDVRPIAAELAAILGGTVDGTNRDGETFDYWTTIDMGADRISIRRVKATRLEISISARDVPAPIASRIGPQKAPSITVDGTRDSAAIAKDIERRVIAPAQAALTEYRAKARAVQARDGSLADVVALLQADFPNLAFTLESGRETASMRGTGKASTYCHARVEPNGGVYFERIGTLPADKARRVLAILNEGSAT
jgi:hypothetical protein